jgi:hypothetical protein
LRLEITSSYHSRGRGACKAHDFYCHQKRHTTFNSSFAAA